MKNNVLKKSFIGLLIALSALTCGGCEQEENDENIEVGAIGCYVAINENISKVSFYSTNSEEPTQEQKEWLYRHFCINRKCYKYICLNENNRFIFYNYYYSTGEQQFVDNPGTWGVEKNEPNVVYQYPGNYLKWKILYKENGYFYADYGVNDEIAKNVNIKIRYKYYETFSEAVASGK